MTDTPVQDLADSFLADMARLDPCAAARSSIAGSETELTDYAPEGCDARAALLRQTQAAHTDLTRDSGFASDDERVTAALLSERIGSQLAQYDAGDPLGRLGIINGPVAAVRSTFDNMPKATAADLEVVAARLAKVPAALASIRAGVAAAIAGSSAPAVRQVLATVEQCRTWAGAPGSGGWFASLAVHCADLEPLAVAAGTAMGELGEWLSATAAPSARTSDAAGPEVYGRAAAMMLGSVLDAREAYEWAWSELHQLEDQMRATIEQILPGGSLVETKAHLDQATAIAGADAWRGWLQHLTDKTIGHMQGTYFDIDSAILECQAMLPPAGGAAAPYYSPPSEDLRVPGRTWYPTLGRDRLPTWEMTTTVYHEAVPGHHLQLARVKMLKDRLCRYRRNTLVSGHIEGWALYAERLMDEIGAYDNDPGGRLGFLSFQALRAARVVIDIGLHLGYPLPVSERPDEGRGSDSWTVELAKKMLVERVGLSSAFASSEVDRYLGWPAQAIGYKLGERDWLAARAEASARLGEAFDLKVWHTTALDLGSLGLTQMRSELAA